MKKNSQILGLLLFALFVLTACGGNAVVDTPVSDTVNDIRLFNMVIDGLMEEAETSGEVGITFNVPNAPTIVTDKGASQEIENYAFPKQNAFWSTVSDFYLTNSDIYVVEQTFVLQKGRSYDLMWVTDPGAAFENNGDLVTFHNNLVYAFETMHNGDTWEITKVWAFTTK